MCEINREFTKLRGPLCPILEFTGFTDIQIKVAINKDGSILVKLMKANKSMHESVKAWDTSSRLVNELIRSTLKMRGKKNSLEL